MHARKQTPTPELDASSLRDRTSLRRTALLPSSPSAPSSHVRAHLPVSMGDIETGASNLAQHQDPRAFARVSLDAKVHEKPRRRRRIDIDPNASARSAADAKSVVLGRRVERGRIFNPPVLLSAMTAAWSSDTDQARPALHPVEH
jgi:hypothetical protein